MNAMARHLALAAGGSMALVASSLAQAGGDGLGGIAVPQHGFSGGASSYQPPVAQQVRIEQRVTIRISPRAMPLSLSAADFEAPERATRITERKMPKCLPLSSIGGVAPDQANRVLLFLRDGRVARATLDKSCRGREYYSGFLVAPQADGMICSGRDQLLARSGANCRVSGFKQIVVEDE